MDRQAFSRNRPFSEGESSCLCFHPPPAMNREEGKGARAGRLPGILRNHRAAKGTGRMIPPWHTQSPAHGKGRGERFGYHSHEAVCSALAFCPERRASPPLRIMPCRLAAEHGGAEGRGMEADSEKRVRGVGEDYPVHPADQNRFGNGQGPVNRLECTRVEKTSIPADVSGHRCSRGPGRRPTCALSDR